MRARQVSWSAVKWRREGQPGLGAMSIPPPPFLFFSLPLTLLYAPPTGRNRSIPGLALPFTSFETPRAALQVRDGGLVLLPPPPLPYYLDTSRPSPRTNWTRLVPPRTKSATVGWWVPRPWWCRGGPATG